MSEPKQVDKTSIFHKRHLQKLLVPEAFCPDCKVSDHVIEDSKRGCRVCTKCGLVIEDFLISDQSEWRTFADNDRNGPDPNRVGSAQHYLMHDVGDFSTTITKTDNSKMSALQKQFGNSVQTNKLSQAIKDIRSHCNRLNLTKDVQNASGELFKALQEYKQFRGKKTVVVIATCVYRAAKECRCPRQLKELCEQFNVDQHSIRKVNSEILKLRAKGELDTSHHTSKGGLTAGENSLQRRKESTAELFSVQFANKLELDLEIIKYIKEITKNCLKYLHGKQPSTVAANALYLACHTSKDKRNQRSYKEIAIVARVTESTIQTTFRKFIYANRISILPDGFGDDIKIVNLTMK